MGNDLSLLVKKICMHKVMINITALKHFSNMYKILDMKDWDKEKNE